MAGDLALQEVADRLRAGLRPTDLLSRGDPINSEISLARLGGDEFTVLLLDLKENEDATIVAERINELLRVPFNYDDNQLVLTASIGIAIYPDDGNNSSSLLKHADSAMYSAKDAGRNSFRFYRPSMTRSAVARMQMDQDLRVALDREEFVLVYQPQYDVEKARMHSVEALIRWNHPQKGLVPPMEFIPRIEANGLIVPIGEWVLRTACRDLTNWRAAGWDIKMAVNISPMQFRDPSLLDVIRRILVDTGVPPDKLELEVTEGGIMECSDANLQTLHALRANGVTIALDDFGTGYSSMSYLKRLPLDHIKVDRSFITGLPHGKDSVAITKAIISLAKNMDFTVTAEGVETYEQVAMLKGLCCDKLQGYYFSKPVPATDMLDLFSMQWVTGPKATDNI